MKLIVFSEEEMFDISIMASGGHVNLIYSMDKPLETAFNQLLPNLNAEIINESEMIEQQADFLDQDEKEYLLESLNNLKTNATNGFNTFLDTFNQIEIRITDIKQFETIEKILSNINIPLVFDVTEIDDQFLLENISKIDKCLHEKYQTKITYLLKQCLSEEEAHYEDNSYTVDEVVLVLTYLNNLINTVKQFNLSQLEQIMYVYDLVKDRYYKHETEEESYLESRDIAKILKNDKIVCLGFSTNLKSALDCLEIDNEIVLLDGVHSKTGHSRNMIIVDDEKYKVNQILFFDSTWDAKKHITDEDNLDRYDFFARNKQFFNILDDDRLILRNYLPYNVNQEDCETIKKLREHPIIQIRKLFSKINWKQYFDSVEITEETYQKMELLMSSFNPLIIHKFEQDDNTVKELYEECSKMLSQKISNDIFLKCLYTVRRIEYYLNPEKFSFDKETVFNIYYNHTLGKIDNSKKIMIRKIIGMDQKLEQQLEEIDFIQKIDSFDKVDTDISRIKTLAKLRDLAIKIKEAGIDENITIKEAVKTLKK